MSIVKERKQDFSDFKRFPKQHSVCDFSKLDKIKWRFVYIRYLGPNVRIYNESKSDYITLTNGDMYRINSPYFDNMNLYINVIIDYLNDKRISYMELLF